MHGAIPFAVSLLPSREKADVPQRRPDEGAYHCDVRLLRVTIPLTRLPRIKSGVVALSHKGRGEERRGV